MPDELREQAATRSGSADASRPAPAARWLSEHGDVLYAFALRRLGRADEAEDAVQDALLAALQAQDRFRQESTERTWLIGILAHKVHDALRRRQLDRARSASHPADSGAELDHFSDGKWRTAPDRWGRAASARLETAEFRAALLRAIDALPELQRTAYCLRELDGLDSGVVCEVLGLTKTNLWTVIHRAKLELRRRLATWLRENA